MQEPQHKSANSSRKLKPILFGLLLGMLFLPVVQEWTAVVPEQALAGVENPESKIPFADSSWFSGSFQESFERRHYGWMGFRASMVRMRNQLDYTLFGETFRSVMVGEDGELVRRGSMKAMRGLDFIGQAKIQYHAEHTALLQRHFAERHVNMLVVLTPSKLRCMPEILPAYDLFANPDNHYARFIEAFAQQKVNFLDLSEELTARITEQKFRIFPRTGTHWTDVGAFYGAQKIIERMEKIGGVPLPDMRLARGGSNSLEMRDTDADAGDLLNFIVDLPADSVYYTEVQVAPYPPQQRPRVLVVGDSFWWKIYNQDIHKRAFAPGSQYRYYNYEVFSDQWKDAKYIHDFNLQSTVENVDWVILCINEGNLHRYPFGFVDQVLRLYYQ